MATLVLADLLLDQQFVLATEAGRIAIKSSMDATGNPTRAYYRLWKDNGGWHDEYLGPAPADTREERDDRASAR